MPDLLERLRAALEDRYAIESEIGRGGMAVVFLAEDLKHRRQVAVKVLSPDLTSEVATERFLREIEIAAGLTHPHILPIHDSGDADGLLFCVMPYVHGESLRERLSREKQLPLDDALQITREVAEALDCAHEQGIVHRDIKPGNILLEHGHAMVADFGIARAVEQAGSDGITKTGLAMGTPAYMSPEQAVGSSDVDGRADIYALGCVLYEMLSGETPYTGPTPQAVLAKKRTEPTPRISVVRETVPPEVEAALTKALAKTPADRFATANQFAEALMKPSGEPQRKPRTWRRVAGLVAFAIAVAAGAMLLDWATPGAVSEADAEAIERLVVAPFENRTGDAAADDWGFVAAEFITRGIDRASVVAVVPASRVRGLVRDMEPAAGPFTDEVVRRTRASHSVAGSYSASNGRLRFEAELVNTETGELLHSLDPVSGSVDSVETVVAVLAERVTAAAAGVLNPGIAKSWSTPPSLEAVSDLLAVQDVFCRRMWRETIDQARPALERNPDFAPVLIMVAYSYANLGGFRAFDSVLALIEPLTDQLATSERLLAEWLRARLYGDPVQETRTVEQLYRVNPGGAGYHAGLTALEANRFEEALERLLANDMESSCYRLWQPWWQAVARAYHMLGRYEDELAIARDGLERFPEFRPLLYFESVAQAGLGRLEAVDSLLTLVNDFPAQPAGLPLYSPGSQMALIAIDLRAMGLREAYESAMDRSLAWFADRPASELRDHRGRAFYYAEHWSEADTLFAALIDEAPTNLEFVGFNTAIPDELNYRGFRGVALAHLGRRVEALQISRWLADVDRPYLQGADTRWRAAIAAALGDRTEAVRLLEQAIQEGMNLGYSHRRDPAWESLRDYRPYQDLIRPRE